MGVNSLWDIIGPTARPVRLEALTRKRLAVDASIWIYQFLKAVRDSEGNSLHQSHIVGFFRRICKLLYFGIQPVFVFDGGAPALKRETIRKRRERREGTQESVIETAQRLLAINVQRQAQEKSRKNEQEMVYADDLPMRHPRDAHSSPERTGKERKKRFIPKDEYHLPDLKKIKVHEHDERLMPEEEFQELTKGSFDVVDGININDVDPNSEMFGELPMSTQYMILSHLRLKSRLRMGYSKEQLDSIFDDSMDFSKFQIQQVKKRNFFTQRLMDLSGMGEDSNGNATRRIAGEKDRQYTLMRTNDGWSLSLDEQEVQQVEDETEKRFDVKEREREGRQVVEVGSDTGSDDDFEDVLEEEEEDEEVNKAIIESIYGQYETQESGKREFVDTGELIEVGREEQEQDFEEIKEKSREEQEDKDLKEAIERSKAELNDMYKKEKEIGMEGLLDLKMDDSVFFQGESEEGKKEKKELDEEKEKEKDVSKEVPEIEEPEIEPEITDVRIIEDPEENKQLGRSRHREVEKDITEVENLVENDEDETGKKYNNDVPEWFGGQIKNDVYFDKIEEKEEEVDDDKEAGLIPWDEAKDYFGDSEDEVEIIEVEGVKEKGEKEKKEKEKEKEGEGEEKGGEEPKEKDKEEKQKEEKQKEEKQKEEKQKEEEQTQEQTHQLNPTPKNVVLDYEFVTGEDKIADQQLISEEQDHQNLKQNMQYEPSLSHSTITEEQLLQERLHKQKRDSDEVTQTMINDIKELLRRFGIPFITAPMEAEAQCVELLKLDLVDGIVTDDSDTFLFGGDKVYKNMFNQKQYVECYFKDELLNKLGLDQTRLIELGLLLGSDYTDGIKGIGPVLAMEILAEFKSLENFKSWFDKCSIGQADSDSPLKRNLLQRVKNGKLYLSSSFPDQVVFEAYTLPEVDHSDEQIKWGVPNLDQIRSFLMFNVGWSQSRVDEVMVPLIRDMNRKLREGTQSTIGEFFNSSSLQSSRELKIGKRMKAAANKLKK